MQNINIKKIGSISFIVYVIISIAFYFIAGEDLHRKIVYRQLDNIKNEKPLYKIQDGIPLSQSFNIKGDTLKSIHLKVSIINNEKKNLEGQNIQAQLLYKGDKIYEKDIPIKSLQEKESIELSIPEMKESLKNEPLTLSLIGEEISENTTVLIWGTDQAIDNNMTLSIGEEVQTGMINLEIGEIYNLWYGPHYWYVFIVCAIAIGIYFAYLLDRQKNGKKSWTLNVIGEFIKYKFLLKQLVKRDFNKKYKRSVLGVLWSFLNPLLTMTVQLIVFSTLFKRDTVNYPVYLLSGTIFFNFFNECSSMGLTSIVGNSNLITKVYVPKYIYPISRCISSIINICLATIPLFMVIIITGLPLNEKMLLLPFVYITLFIFTLGISLILSSCMVFFRDTEFLWRIFTMLWMYFTPLFYTISRMPENLQGIFKFNPMYHYITFARKIILDGVSPEPLAYVWCALFAIISLAVGIIVFNKNQDKFILNL